MKIAYSTGPLPAEPGICRSCNAPLQGKFCNECGEKAFEAGEHSVKHFFGDVLNAITFLDGRFLRTIKMMFVSPGSLSYQWINGRRMPFIKPMSMFFIANLIYFMFQFYDSVNSTLSTQMYLQPYSPIAERMVKERVKADKITVDDFSIKYNQQSTNMSKLWLFLMVIYYSIPLALINLRSKLFYFDHLTVSLELSSMVVMVVLCLTGWVMYGVIHIVGWMGGDISFMLEDRYNSTIAVILTFILTYNIERTTYQQTKFQSIGKAALLVASFVGVIYLYRASLFFITMWTL